MQGDPLSVTSSKILYRCRNQRSMPFTEPLDAGMQTTSVKLRSMRQDIVRAGYCSSGADRSKCFVGVKCMQVASHCLPCPRRSLHRDAKYHLQLGMWHVARHAHKCL
jgi:hypothetical protein